MFKRRIRLPLVSLMATLIACGIMVLSSFMLGGLLLRLLQGQSIATQAAWLHFIAAHTLLLKVLVRYGLLFTVIGSGLTLFLLLRGEPLVVIHRRLRGISWMILLMTAAVVLLMVSCYCISEFQIYQTTYRLGLPMGVPNIGTLLLVLWAVAVGSIILFFVVTSNFFAMTELHSRLRAFRTARAADGVLQ